MASTEFQIEIAKQNGFPVDSAAAKHLATAKGSALSLLRHLRLKCYGYVLTVAGKTVVYTGDTRTLEPFLPYLHPGSFIYLNLRQYKAACICM